MVLLDWWETSRRLSIVHGPTRIRESADALCITRSDICQAIETAAVANGDKAASCSSHSGRVGGATLLLQAGASVNTIKLAGRWKGDTWSIYFRMTSTAMYGIAADMIGESSKKQVSADDVRVRWTEVLKIRIWFGCKAFRQFVEGVLLRASTHEKWTFPKRLLLFIFLYNGLRLVPPLGNGI